MLLERMPTIARLAIDPDIEYVVRLGPLSPDALYATIDLLQTYSELLGDIFTTCGHLKSHAFIICWTLRSMLQERLVMCGASQPRYSLLEELLIILVLVWIVIIARRLLWLVESAEAFFEFAGMSVGRVLHAVDSVYVTIPHECTCSISWFICSWRSFRTLCVQPRC